MSNYYLFPSANSKFRKSLSWDKLFLSVGHYPESTFTLVYLDQPWGKWHPLLADRVPSSDVPPLGGSSAPSSCASAHWDPSPPSPLQHLQEEVVSLGRGAQVREVYGRWTILPIAKHLILSQWWNWFMSTLISLQGLAQSPSMFSSPLIAFWKFLCLAGQFWL
jgi:hypothetical protein